MTEESSKIPLNSVDEYEQEAKKLLAPELVNYIYGGTETGATLTRNRTAFAKYLLRRRVLLDIDKVETEVSYFGGKIKSELPFYPACVNTSPLYPKAIVDFLRIGNSYKVPIFISDIAIADGLEPDDLPRLVPPDVPLIWQIYIFKENYDTIFKRAKMAQQYGYRGLVITVDADLNIKIGNEIPNEVRRKDFHKVKLSEIKRLRNSISLPFIVKGIMAPEDAVVAVENGADGIIVSNHGGRIMDAGESSIEVLSGIAKRLRSKKSTRKTELFYDGGIMRGADILKALALGASGCLLGRAMYSGVAVDREHGAEKIMNILKDELLRTAYFCGVEDLSDVSSKILVEA
jgi:isopentenyl diphosphate isomerase/L-lactate dehydrogenase-like FMN-dependent dehydrogenase